MWAELDQRRLTRGPCKCSLEDRPQDRYGIFVTIFWLSKLETELATVTRLAQADFSRTELKS